MSDSDQRIEERDPVETARQVHTLAQRLLQHVASDVRGSCETTQPGTTAESNSDDQPVTYWYP